MNILLITVNPNPHSLTHALANHTAKKAEERGHHVVIRDLYKIKFNAILGPKDFNQLFDGIVPKDIRREQEHIADSDLIIFMYPIWWAGAPALMKGYIDRVILKNFAYEKHSNGTFTKRLTKKKALIINTMGASIADYADAGFLDAMKTVMDRGVIEFVGLQNLGHHFFGESENLSEEKYHTFISRLDAILEKIL